MNRKRAATVPALILLSDVSDIPVINSINSPEYLIGRSPEANLIILQQNISRKHCTLKYDEESEKWFILSHSRSSSVFIQGNSVKANDSIAVECGDKIKISPCIVFEFKCSPDSGMKCCMDLKRIKISGEEDTCSTKHVEDSFIPNDSLIPNDSSELPSTLPVSQLRDSSNINDFSLLDSNNELDSQSLPATNIYTLPGTSDILDSNLPLGIDDLHNAIQNYVDHDECSDFEDVSYHKSLKDELNFRIEFLKKLDELNSSCELHFSDSNSGLYPTIVAIKNLTTFFKEDYLRLTYRNKEFSNKSDGRLNRIILNMDAILMEKTQSVMSFVHKFLDTSFNKELLNSSDHSQNLFAGDLSDLKSRNTCNVEEHENVIRENNLLKAENEKYKEEIEKYKNKENEADEKYKQEVKKYKDNISWQESRMKFLEFKIKEKEKLEAELEVVKEDSEMLEKQNSELKRSLANFEIMELEYKCVLETNKHREEDRRSKDALERTINTLNNTIKQIKEENAQLVADKFVSLDEISKLKEKCNDLEEKVKEKIVVATSSIATCIGDKASESDCCCDMVKEVKASLIDLMESEFQCSICGDMFIESTVTNCNHVFCTCCLQEWKKKQKRCPMCRAQIVKEVKVPILDNYISGLLKLVSEKMYSERLKTINDRKSKTPTPASRTKNTRRRNQQASGVVDLS